jgi:hypothetical protein
LIYNQYLIELCNNAAYECYATFNGVTKALFTNSPPAGNTVVDLLGFAKRSVSGSVSFP